MARQQQSRRSGKRPLSRRPTKQIAPKPKPKRRPSGLKITAEKTMTRYRFVIEFRNVVVFSIIDQYPDELAAVQAGRRWFNRYCGGGRWRV